MPPRLQLLSRASHIARPPYQPLAPFLYPFLSQHRQASILSSLSDTKGSYNKRIRVGRGPSSGYGKTSGRGHKGQKQHGKVPAGFQGGQTPDWVVHGTRGFKNRFSTELSPINLNRIQYWINAGRLDPSQPITLKELNRSRCIHGVAKDGVKLLARGKEELTTPINIIVSRASAEAIKAVEQVGGSVTTRYYTKFAIDKVGKDQMDAANSLQSRIAPVAAGEEGVMEEGMMAAGDAMFEGDAFDQAGKGYRFRLPDPISRKKIEYYRDEAHRGYLSYQVKEGHGPSLFFKTPGTGERKKSVKSGKKKTASGESNRLW